MARGKYAAKAERRRETAETEQRAITAERERDRLAADLAALRESSEREITALRDRVRELGRQRDEAAAPRIAELEAANNRLRVQRDIAATKLKGMTEIVFRLDQRMLGFLRDRFGLTKIEAEEVVDALGLGSEFTKREMIGRGAASRDPRMVETVQRARGMRRHDDPAADAAPFAQPAVRTGQDRARARSAVMVEAEELYSRAYAYDGPEGSVTIAMDGSGDTHVCLENAEVDELDGMYMMAVLLPASEAAKLAEAITNPEDGR